MQNDIITPEGSGGFEDEEPQQDPLHLASLPPVEAAGKDRSGDKPPKKRSGRIKRWKQLGKRQRIISLVVIGVMLIGTSAVAMKVLTKNPQPTPARITNEPQPTTKPSRLTGVEVAIELDDMPVTGVMIENSPDARPQSGLQEAGIVFEAIAEGGITRFLALYHTERPKSIGPVRSVRPYYLDYLVPFNAAIAHAGGSAQALSQIRSQRIRDLDQFANPAAYQRVSSRFAPHNLYTSREKLLKIHQARGYNSSKFTGFERKREKPLETAKASKISFNISSFNYNSVFTYQKKSNSYLRTMAGRPHKDEKTGKRIAPKVVIALISNHSYAGIYSVYKTNGKGSALIFQDGDVIKATWHKKNRKGELTFTDAAGKPVKLNPGQTWITLADNTGQVKY